MGCMCGQGCAEGIQGLSIHNGCWQHVPGWNGTWVESLLVVAPSSLNVSKRLGMVCSGVSDGSYELICLNVYKVIYNLVLHDDTDLPPPGLQCFPLCFSKHIDYQTGEAVSNGKEPDKCSH